MAGICLLTTQQQQGNYSRARADKSQTARKYTSRERHHGGGDSSGRAREGTKEKSKHKEGANGRQAAGARTFPG